jgi:hypothetical protein
MPWRSAKVRIHSTLWLVWANDVLFRYLSDEFTDKKKIPFDREGWELIPTTPSAHWQTNGSDCGVFVCVFAEVISLDKVQSGNPCWSYWITLKGCCVHAAPCLPAVRYAILQNEHRVWYHTRPFSGNVAYSTWKKGIGCRWFTVQVSQMQQGRESWDYALPTTVPNSTKRRACAKRTATSSFWGLQQLPNRFALLLSSGWNHGGLQLHTSLLISLGNIHPRHKHCHDLAPFQISTKFVDAGMHVDRPDFTSALYCLGRG